MKAKRGKVGELFADLACASYRESEIEKGRIDNRHHLDVSDFSFFSPCCNIWSSNKADIWHRGATSALTVLSLPIRKRSISPSCSLNAKIHRRDRPGNVQSFWILALGLLEKFPGIIIPPRTISLHWFTTNFWRMLNHLCQRHHISSGIIMKNCFEVGKFSKQQNYRWLQCYRSHGIN